jgi:hypothetical protein
LSEAVQQSEFPASPIGGPGRPAFYLVDAILPGRQEKPIAHSRSVHSPAEMNEVVPLVEVGLEVLAAQPVIDAQGPNFEIGKRSGGPRAARCERPSYRRHGDHG